MHAQLFLAMKLAHSANILHVLSLKLFHSSIKRENYSD